MEYEEINWEPKLDEIKHNRTLGMRGERYLRVFYLKYNSIKLNMLENNEREVREEEVVNFKNIFLVCEIIITSVNY